MIIGINGKIGSGKDTIGKIAQCLINHPKITSKDLLWMMENNIVSEHSECEIKKFAGKLKQTASLFTGVPVEKFEDQEFKKQEMAEEWWYWSNSDNTTTKIPYTEQTKILAKSDSDIVLYKTTYREFLQKLGTEAMRDGLHTNVWCNALFADYTGRKTRIHQLTPVKRDFDVDTYPNWIITDMRFPNEMKAVVEKGGITIRVVREKLPIKHSKTGKIHLLSREAFIEHPSETALDDAEFDYEIINDAGIPELIEKVKQILITEKII